MKNARCVVLRVYLFLYYLLIYAPIAIVFIASFDSGRDFLLWKGFTWDNYLGVIQNNYILLALSKSFRVALFVSVISVAIGIPAAMAYSRCNFPGRSLFGITILIPLIIPEIALGTLWLCLFYSQRIPLGFYTILAAHIMVCTSFVIINGVARMKNYNRSIEEAAFDLGADEATVLKKITLPIIMPAVYSGFLLSFVLSFNNLVITLFCSGVGSTTLPLKFYSLLKSGNISEINVIASIMLFITLILVILSEKWARDD